MRVEVKEKLEREGLEVEVDLDSGDFGKVDNGETVECIAEIRDLTGEVYAEKPVRVRRSKGTRSANLIDMGCKPEEVPVREAESYDLGVTGQGTLRLGFGDEIYREVSVGHELVNVRMRPPPELVRGGENTHGGRRTCWYAHVPQR